MVIRVKCGGIINLGNIEKAIRLECGNTRVTVFDSDLGSWFGSFRFKAHSRIIKSCANSGIQFALGLLGGIRPNAVPIRFNCIFNGWRNMHGFAMPAIPDTKSMISFEIILRAGINRVNRPMVKVTILFLGDKILPAKRIQRRVVFKIKSIAKMKRLAGQNFQFTINVVGVGFANGIIANDEIAFGYKPIFNIS